VVPNDQDIARMQRGLDALWDAGPDVIPGYLIAGHGSYVWAPDMPTALLRMEALEFMLRCELEERRQSR
jgi:methylthioribulose-1-phosphate dehydratase